MIKSNNTNFKGVGQPLRIILTGSKFGPGIYDIIISLGKDEVQKRLDKAVEKTLEDGLRTPDIMSKGKKKVSTSEMGDAIISNLN